MALKRYYLANHAHTCTTDSHWMFLNLLSDRYFAVEKARLTDIQHLLHGFDSEEAKYPTKCLQSSSRPESNLLSTLTELGLLTLDSSQGKAMRPLQARTAVDTIKPTIDSPSITDCAAKFPRVALSLYSTQRSLNHESLNQTVFRISRKKAAAERRQLIHADSSESLSQAIAIFHALRPLFPRDYKCLFDSLALLDFLIPIQARVEWIFGVASDPFSAHCWLQLDGTVLNDTLESIAEYRPIMIV